VFQTKKIEDGHTGYTVQFTRVIDQPGKPQVRRVYRFRYRMFTNKVLVGTVVPPPTTPPPTPSPPPTPTSPPPTIPPTTVSPTPTT
jgi:hypothetical protein